MDDILIQTGNKVWAKFNLLYPELSKFPAPSIKFNNRFTSTAGMCYYTENRIEISRKLFDIDKEEILNQTVPHEYAHQVSWNLFQASGHCAIWKSVMVKYGLKPERTHSIGFSKTEDRETMVTEIRANLVEGLIVQFEHRDRSRKVTIHRGVITKINLKTIKVDVNGSVWTVPVTTPSLKVIK